MFGPRENVETKSQLAEGDGVIDLHTLLSLFKRKKHHSFKTSNASLMGLLLASAPQLHGA